MSQKHYIDSEGKYLGGFVDGATPAIGAREVPSGPPHGLAIWTGSGWQWDQKAHDRKSLSLTFAQLLTGLVSEGWITEQEGLDWLKGEVPMMVKATIQTLPAQHRFAAYARAVAPTYVDRLDPLVSALGTVAYKSEDDLDVFFRKYTV